MEITIAVVVVTDSRDFFETGLAVLNDISGKVFERVDIEADFEDVQSGGLHVSPAYEDAKAKAIAYLKTRKDRIHVKVLQASSLEAAADKVIRSSRHGDGDTFQVGMVYIDCASMQGGGFDTESLDASLGEFYHGLRSAEVATFFSPFSTAAFLPNTPTRIRYQPMNFIECRLTGDAASLQAEMLCLWMDFFEMTYTNRRVKPQVQDTPTITLGQHIFEFLSRRAGNDWLGFYFTGSMVSNLIRYFEEDAGRRGVKTLRGPNEHSLACGAMANWQLYQKPFVIVVTSGMIDEFRGTLANLREARAKGFIICAENRASQWFAFQGTVSKDEDTRDVMAARRMPCVYMDDVERIGEDLEKAAHLYDADEGPVILLATQAVLEATRELSVDFPEIPNQTTVPTEIGENEAALQRAMEVINNGPDRVVWQCGPMDEDELELTLSIARRAGIALVDSLVHPGSVPKYHKGVRNPNYLGTLGAYGYHARVYNFLHTNGKLNPASSQHLFFLKSKLPQIATPFSEGRLNNGLEITQLTLRPDHIAPHADNPLVMSYRSFLQYVDRHLDVPPDLVERRHAALNRMPDTASDVVSRLPRLPMTPNHFFYRLNGVVEQLIEQEGYDYTGLYDVGRCGISAIRNVARTRRGFSGWYGRALMGDALMALPSIAHTAPTDILGFIGDGAKAVVPDVLPSMIENLLSHSREHRTNITVFYFMNGGYSVINTYQERILFNRTSRQMRLVNVLDHEWEETIMGVKFCSRVIDRFDDAFIANAIREKGRVNFFSVVTAHNNEGDGISLATAGGWQRDKPSMNEVL